MSIAEFAACARAADAQIGRGRVPGLLLDEAGLRLLLDTAPDTNPPRSLGWVQGGLGSTRWCGHAGGGAGYYGELRLYPQIRRASALLLNVADFQDRGLLDAFDRHWLVAHRR